MLAVDPNAALLQQLTARVPEQRRARLKIHVGSLPDIEFKSGGFAAVHAARVLHRLDGPAIEYSLRKFFRWLYPHGRLFVSVLTPLGSFWEPFHRQFIRRNVAGERWPGYIDDVSRFLEPDEGDTGSIHLLNERILRREIEAAGFVIEKASYYPLPWDSEQICCGIIGRCGS